MSRLDYVTIAIVAVCIAALVYLIYMTTNLFGGEETDGVTQTVPEEPEDNSDTYYFDDSEAYDDSTETANAGYNDAYDYENGEALDKGRSESTTSRIGESTESSPETYSPSSSTTTASYGEYMVLAGTFSVRTNADAMVNKLQAMGYSEASVESFDRGSYAVVLVDRFASISEAQRLVGELKEKGVESYVKKKN